MSTAAWVATGAGLAIVLLAMALVRTRSRLVRVEARTAAVEARLAGELVPAIEDAHTEARAARLTARRAATAAGVDEPPRRLPFEPITGPVVRAAAFGAGARRTLVRLATPRRPRGRTSKAA
jgi:hypothetical protein